MSAASPGVVSLFFHNDYYKTHEEYLYAIADAMQYEYETIASAGLVLHLDCPDLGWGRRIGRYATLVGRENVMLGTDCGYGTWVGQAAVDPDVVWGKLASMAEGARIASKRFWGNAAVHN